MPLPDTAPAPLSTLSTLAPPAEAQRAAREHDGAAFDVCHGALALRALVAVNGAVLWTFASGGSCLSGAAISEGMLFWGSGYTNFGFGTFNNKLYAFGLPS